MASERHDHSNKDRTYHEWHRRSSLARFIPKWLAFEEFLIDIDNPPISIAYACRFCWETFALAEDCSDGSDVKQTRITENLGRKANVPVYLIRWITTGKPNPNAEGYADIDAFRVRRLVPDRDDFEDQTPQEHAEWLFRMRCDHYANDCSVITETQLKQRWQVFTTQC